LRYFFNSSYPPCSRVLLIESGSRHLIENVIPSLYVMLGQDIEIDLVTCYAGEPAGFRGRVFRVTEYGGAAGRNQLLADLSPHNYTIAGMICAAEPIMTKWKWWLAAHLPAKFFVVNENGDYFWLNRVHWRTILRFALYRGGLTGSAAVPALVRLALFPLTLAYLLLYAGTVHLRRAHRRKSVVRG
jgi:hypothetical protein